MKVWLLTKGDGWDGNEWGLISIHKTKESAEAAKTEYEKPISRPDGSQYALRANEVEEWEVGE